MERFLTLARDVLRLDPGMPRLAFALPGRGENPSDAVSEQRRYWNAMTASRIKVRLLKLKLKGPLAQAALKEFQKETEENDFLAALFIAQGERF